jgi:hypothetical protein
MLFEECEFSDCDVDYLENNSIVRVRFVNCKISAQTAVSIIETLLKSLSRLESIEF